MIVVALHGFFGVPEDWRNVLANLDPEMEVDVVTPDLAIWATRAGVVDFETFAASFNRSVKLLAEERDEPVMIVGYSLGARLAAHCLLQAANSAADSDADLYRAALLVSLNPGLPQNDLQLRRERVETDAAWSERMRRSTWSDTWSAWNGQSVLRSGTRALRRTDDRAKELADLGRRVEGRREAWARAMEIWTLGHQADLREDLIEWATEDGRRLTLMTGTDDIKFTELTTTWLANSSSAFDDLAPDRVRHRKVMGAGHRVLVEASDDVVSEVSALISLVEE